KTATATARARTARRPAPQRRPARATPLCSCTSKSDAHRKRDLPGISGDNIDVGVGALNELPIQNVSDVQSPTVTRPVVVERSVNSSKSRNFQICGGIIRGVGEKGRGVEDAEPGATP